MFRKIRNIFFSNGNDKYINITFKFADGVEGKLLYKTSEYNPRKSFRIIKLIANTKYFELGRKKNTFIKELISQGVFQIIFSTNGKKQTQIIANNKTTFIENNKTKTTKKINLFFVPTLLFFASAMSYLMFSIFFNNFEYIYLLFAIVFFAEIVLIFAVFRKVPYIIEWGLFASLLGFIIGLFYLWLLFVDEIYLINPSADGPKYVSIFYPLFPNVFALIFNSSYVEKEESTKNLNVVMIGAKKYPSRDGGIDAVVSTISELMANQGHSVTVYTRRKSDSVSSNAKVKTKKIFTINKKATDALLYSFFATIRALFSKADVIHFHAEGNCFFLWLTRFSKKRIITTIHGLDWQREKFKGIGTKILLKSEKRICKYSDDIIVLSKKDYDYFKNTYGIETTIIPNGFEKLENLDPVIIKEKYDLDKDSYFLFLARIVPEKGLHYLIDAFKRTKIKKKLVIAGDSNHAKEYHESIMKLASGDDRIIFTGFVCGQELNELFSNAYCYVLPSDIEGMPISLLEALGHKRICLVSDIPENHLDDDNSIYFGKSSVESLKKKLVQINIKRPTFVDNSKLMSWNDVVARTVEIYRKGLSKK